MVYLQFGFNSICSSGVGFRTVGNVKQVVSKSSKTVDPSMSPRDVNRPHCPDAALLNIKCYTKWKFD